jgi:crotonobetainyl-CoA:carnitine CoA-transferase CaiB-like acyl-CoA transferase
MSSPSHPQQPKPSALEGIRVLDAATLFAGPLAAMLLGDFGADVIKIEHPKGDAVRSHGYSKNGVPLWWKVINRNKQAITLNLSVPEGQEILTKLASQSDVLIESFRPGTLEKWNLGPDVLHQVNPRLVIARVTGFGQVGPYKSRPGFGTLAEAMSGFAAMTGEPDGPPTLPPFGLADGITGLATTVAIMMALHARDTLRRGQVIDMAIIEPILTILGPQPTWFDQLGIVQERRGNRSVNNAPRNVYRTADDRWVAISTSAQNVAERVLTLVERPDVVEQEWFRSGAERAKHADELDAIVGSWIAKRPLSEVVASFEAAEAAVAPIFDVRDIFKDPQYQALGSIVDVQDRELGSLKMQNVIFRLSDTPGNIRFAGRAKGEDNQAIYMDSLGLDSKYLDELAARGVI